MAGDRVRVEHEKRGDFSAPTHRVSLNAEAVTLIGHTISIPSAAVMAA
jgi:hypothetical protein